MTGNTTVGEGSFDSFEGDDMSTDGAAYDPTQELAMPVAVSTPPPATNTPAPRRVQITDEPTPLEEGHDPGPTTIDRGWDVAAQIATLATAAADSSPKAGGAPRVSSLPGHLADNNPGLFDNAAELSDPVQHLLKRFYDLREMFRSLKGSGVSIAADQLDEFFALIEKLGPALAKKEDDLKMQEEVSRAQIRIADFKRDSQDDSEELKKIAEFRAKIMADMRQFAQDKREFAGEKRALEEAKIAFEDAKLSNNPVYEKMAEAEAKIRSADLAAKNLKKLQLDTWYKMAAVLIVVFGAAASGYVYRGMQVKGSERDPVAEPLPATSEEGKDKGKDKGEDKGETGVKKTVDNVAQMDASPVEYPESAGIYADLEPKKVCKLNTKEKLGKMLDAMQTASSNPDRAFKIQLIIGRDKNCKRAVKREIVKENGDKISILSTISGHTVNPEVLEAALKTYKGDKKIAQLTIFRNDDKDGLPLKIFGYGKDGVQPIESLNNGNEHYLFLPVQKDTNKAIGNLGRMIDGEAFEAALRSAHAGFSYEQYLKKADSLEGEALDNGSYEDLRDAIEGEDLLQPVAEK